MSLDFPTLDALRTYHAAWRLLRADQAPLVASFLHRVFVAPNVRVIAAADLAEALEDELYAPREQLGDGGFPAPALDDLKGRRGTLGSGIGWDVLALDGAAVRREARLPRVIFVK